MESNKLALLCRDLAENKKAENTVILDVRNLSSITDYFVITSGATEPHLRAIVHEITDRLRRDHGLSPRAIDGELNTPWQVMDYFDVIVHVMRTDVREKYDLEGLWGDAAKVAPRQAQSAPAQGKGRARNGGAAEKAGENRRREDGLRRLHFRLDKSRLPEPGQATAAGFAPAARITAAALPWPEFPSRPAPSPPGLC